LSQFGDQEQEDRKEKERKSLRSVKGRDPDDEEGDDDEHEENCADSVQDLSEMASTSGCRGHKRCSTPNECTISSRSDAGLLLVHGDNFIRSQWFRLKSIRGGEKAKSMQVTHTMKASPRLTPEEA
jgi:hypothetical protein